MTINQSLTVGHVYDFTIKLDRAWRKSANLDERLKKADLTNSGSIQTLYFTEKNNWINALLG